MPAKKPLICTKGNEPSLFHVTFENAKPNMAKSLEQQTYQFLKALGKFDYALSSLDRVWKVLFKGPGQQWNYLYISKYHKTYFINHVNGESGTLEVEPVMDVQNVGDAVLHMASLPLSANILFMNVMATKMPFVGRG